MIPRPVGRLHQPRRGRPVAADRTTNRPPPTSTAQRITAVHPAKVTVTAYTTDAPGTQPSTTEVSQQRGNAVAAALKAQLPPATIPVEVISKGAADPIATNGTHDGRQLNRRVTVTTS